MTRAVDVLNVHQGVDTILPMDSAEVSRSQSRVSQSWLKQALPPGDYELTLDLPLSLSAELFPEVFSYGPNNENVLRFMRVLHKEALKAWSLPRHLHYEDKHKEERIRPGECPFIDEMMELYCPAEKKNRELVTSMQMFMRAYGSWPEQISSGMSVVHLNCTRAVELAAGSVYDISKRSATREALDGQRVLYCLTWAMASVGILPSFTPVGILGRVWDKRIMAVVEKYEQG